jgi:hypothetical protein
MVRPRKGKNSPQLRSVSSDGSVNNEKLDEILEKLACLDSITAKLANLESMYAASQAENKQLKEVIDTQNVTIRNLQDRHNNLEQHGRSFSVRVNNFPLDGVDERDPPAIIDKVYKQVFLPILTGAEAIKAISHIPSCYDMIEMAHPLPAKGGATKPIIVRFFNRNIKSLLFKHRKEYATKVEPAGPKPRYKYPFMDDLTRDNYVKMKQMQADPRVHSCWASGGSLRYRRVDSDNIIRRVQSVYLSVDDILK